jgi:hypothetical protein
MYVKMVHKGILNSTFKSFQNIKNHGAAEITLKLYSLNKEDLTQGL